MSQQIVVSIFIALLGININIQKLFSHDLDSGATEPLNHILRLNFLSV